MLLASASNGDVTVVPGSALIDKDYRFLEDLERQNHDMHSHVGLRTRSLQYIPS